MKKKTRKREKIRTVEDFTFDGWETPAVSPKLERAAKRVAAYAGRAQIARELGNDPKEHDAKAERWRDWKTGKEKKDPHGEYGSLAEKANELVDALLVRAEVSDAPDVWLSIVLDNILVGMHELAANGDQQIAHLLAGHLGRAADKFNILAHHKPEIFKPWASKQFGIPGIISPNAEKSDDNAKLVELLQVGESFHLSVMPKRRGKSWKHKTEANALAVRLISYMRSYVSNCNLYKTMVEAGIAEPFPAWLDKATALPPLTVKTSDAWAEVGWEILSLVSPGGNPGRHPRFYDPKTQICSIRTERVDGYFQKTVRSKSIPENDIRRKLFEAFKIIARDSPPPS